MQITFENVKGYATIERATKRGQEVEAILIEGGATPRNVRWLVMPCKDGRWVPAFIFNTDTNPALFMTNVCTFN